MSAYEVRWPGKGLEPIRFSDLMDALRHDARASCRKATVWRLQQGREKEALLWHIRFRFGESAEVAT